MKKPLWMFVCLLLLFSKLVAQKKIHVPLTDENLNTIDDWRDLGGAQKIPMNKNWPLSLLHKLEHYERYDSLQLVKWVDSLGCLKMDQTFHMLSDLCCRYVDYSRNTKLSRMAWVLNHYGGPQALNKYYLNDSIAPRPGDPNTFHAEVYYAIREKHGVYMSFSYYMKKPDKPVPPPPLPKAISRELKQRTVCDSAIVIDDNTVNDIDSPWQLFGLDAETDSMLKRLTEISREYDSIEVARWVDALIQNKSEGARCLVFSAMFRPLVIHDLNLFNGLAGTLSYFGGYQAANRHYLNGAVDEHLPWQDFASEVYRRMQEHAPECYYCKPKTEDQVQIAAMKKIDTRAYDREITRIIRSHSNLDRIGGYLNYGIALDSIYQQVLRLEGITDAMYDACQIKIDLYPGYAVLGVIIDTEPIPVQKCYRIQLGQVRHFSLFHKTCRFLIRPGSLNRLVFHSKDIYYKPGFVAEERQRCEEAEERQRQNEEELRKLQQN